MSERPDLTITVISWNTKELLRACLESLYRDTGRLKVEVHVVDNGSADGSPEMVQAEFPRATLITNEENLGFASANNQSWARAQGRYWLLLNSDAEVRTGALDVLVHFMDVHPRAGLATARLVNPDGTPQNCAQPEPSIFLTLFEASRLHKLLPARVRGRVLLGPYWTYDQPMRLGWTWGTALIARREAVDGAGALSDDFFMYGEDLEWCLRMRRFGWEIWFCPNAEVVHYGGQSSQHEWDDRSRTIVKLNGICRAIGKHHGRLYVRALQAVNLAALVAESFAARLRGAHPGRLAAPLGYYRRALTGIGPAEQDPDQRIPESPVLRDI